MVRVERAHAKLNLLLRVLAREASGYHGIETLFQRLALHDVVRVRLSDGPCALTCTGPRLPVGGLGAPSSNLAWRAAEAYVTACRWNTGWTIEIEKHIPVGGGLGGGSADAAAVLRAMESLSPMPMGNAALLALGGSLGADVPFLLSETSLAFAWGRGDRLFALPTLPIVPVTLLAFDEGVNTGAAYAALAGARAERNEAVGALAYAADAFATWPSVCALAANDFEPIVSKLHAGVGALLPRVRAMARGASSPAIGMMSGSGATCFLLGDLPRATMLPAETGTDVIQTRTA